MNLGAMVITGGGDSGVMGLMGNAFALRRMSTPMLAISTWGVIKGRPVMPKPASHSSRRALLMPQVNPGSRYRCGKSN